MLFILSSNFIFGQNSISGIVVDKKTNEPLPFATVVINKNLGIITNTDGEFSIDHNTKIKTIDVSYIGYKNKIIESKNNKLFYKVSLNRSSSMLNEVILVEERVNPALRIIREVINNKEKNNPDKVLKSYKYNSYSKFLVTANPDSIKGTVDSVWYKKDGELVFKHIDSSNYEMKKTLDRSHLYLSEKVSRLKYNSKKGKQEEVLASRMAGFKEPIYEFMMVNLQSISFYDEYYTVFGTKYLNPIANKAVFKEYNYKILDTLKSNNYNVFMIYYNTKNNKKDEAGLEGLIYVNEHNYAIQKVISELKAVITVTATINYEYQKENDIWFPSETDLLIKKGDNGKNLSFLGGSVQFESSKNDSINKTVRQNDDFNASDYIYMSSITKNFDIETNIETKIKKSSLAIIVDDDVNTKDEIFWNKFRTDTITKRDKETYVVIDSIIEEEGIENKINLLRSLSTGFYPTKYFDIDINKFLNYNNFEGIRIGFGGKTSTNISSILNIDGYAAYGVNDYAFKGKAGINLRLNKISDTWVGIKYGYDLEASSKISFITDENTFVLNDVSSFNNDFFYSENSSMLYIKHNLTPNTRIRAEFSKSYSRPEYNYSYINNNENITKFDLSIAKLGVNWEPNSKYIQTKHGIRRMHAGYPKLTAQYTHSFKNILDSDLNFSKIDLRIEHLISTYKLGITKINLEGGFAFGDTPIHYLYGSSPNSQLSEPWLRRVNLAGINSFETMLYREFFSDKYVELHLRHTFNTINITEKIKPQLSLITRFAIGSLNNIDYHKNIKIKTLEKGYYESGLEINKIWAGLGLGTYYRYGPYSNYKWDDNLFIKVSYRFSLSILN